MDKQTAASLSASEVVEKLNSRVVGLASSEVAKQVLLCGPNKIGNNAGPRALAILLHQFENSLVYLLAVAGLLAFILRDIYDGLFIVAILLINTGLSFFQEYKSERAVEKLATLVNRQALVLRDKKQMLIDEQELTIGDVVIIKEGDVVPADIKLIESNELATNESQLTGESEPVNKSTEGEFSLLFAGSTIAKGEGKGIVYAIGLSTELGRIAKLSTETRRTTPYEQSLERFSGLLIKITLVTLALVLVAKLLIVHDVSSTFSLLLFIIALSVTVVPEALPAIAALTLSSGALKLAKQHVIVKSLTSVEDLGNITVLCTDKTGTLTEDSLKITKIDSSDEDLFQQFAYASMTKLANKHAHYRSAFDEAFNNYISNENKTGAKKYKIIKELPFDPATRSQEVILNDGKQTILVVLGAPESLLALSTGYEKSIKTKLIEDGKRGLRHLAIAFKQINYSPDKDIESYEHELKFLGFAVFEDPLRSTARQAIELAEKLGVSIRILSGDSREVTQYVAEQVGLIKTGDKVYIGDELAKLSDTAVSSILQTHFAFAKLTPEQKYRIISMLKAHGEVVGYQGDGINDAPSLKLADVSIAVNNATDVAKESADIVLLRHDLNVIISGIELGRTTFSNINKYIRYTMVGNFGNFFALSALYLLSTSLPILTIQLLLTSLLTDLPLVAIATDNVETSELMRPSHYNARNLIALSLILGSITGLVEIVFFALTSRGDLAVNQSSLFMFLTALQLTIIISVRNRGHFWRAPKMSWDLRWSFLITALLVVWCLVTPLGRALFILSPIPLWVVGLACIVLAIYIISLDAIKVWFYRTRTGTQVSN